MTVRPNFLVLGPAKTGSTSLHYYLGQHPDVFVCPVKETAFFAFEGMPDHPANRDKPFVRIRLADYEALFAGVTGETVIGDVSPQYLGYASPAVIERIRRYLDDPRLITVLRHPVERAYSMFNMHLREGRRPGDDDFVAVMRRELDPGGDGPGHDLEQLGFTRDLADAVKLYVDAFPSERLGFFLYEDLHADSAALMRRVFAFLDVDPDHPIDTSFRLNRAGTHRNPVLTALLESPNPIRFAAGLRLRASRAWRARARRLSGSKVRAAKLDPEVRRELSVWFRDDILRLQDMARCDLSHWFE